MFKLSLHSLSSSLSPSSTVVTSPKPLCSHAESCLILSKEHKEGNMHYCKHGSACKHINDSTHNSLYLHTPKISPRVLQPSPRSPKQQTSAPCSPKQQNQAPAPSSQQNPLSPLIPSPWCMILNCKAINDERHTKAFLHMFKNGPHCSNIRDPVHVSKFSHANSSPDIPQRVATKDAVLVTLCKDGGECRVTANKKHMERHTHPCKYDSECRLKSQKDAHGKEHRARFTHTCIHGSGCSSKREQKHARKYTHEGTPRCLPLASLLSFPARWDKAMMMKNDYAVIQVKEASAEWSEVINRYQEAAGKASSFEIYRIQNVKLWALYFARRSNIKANNNGDANEQLLWHTATPTTQAIISRDGYNYNVSNTGDYGYGIYFYANIPQNKAQVDDAETCLFLNFVTTGSCAAGASGMKKPPVKSSSELHDSVYGNSGKEIVIFDNLQAYPIYKLIRKK